MGLWKTELQELAREIDLDIQVCRLPPGTGKRNRIGHQLLSFTGMNWRSQPLRDLETIIGLIACTTTKSGLIVHCLPDETHYPKGNRVTRKEIAAKYIRLAGFHGEWNRTLLARPEAQSAAVIV